MQSDSPQRRWPGLGLVIVLLGIVTAWCIWTAAQHTATVDDTAGAGWPDMRIDINTAGAAELALLPGLGDRLAQRIIDDREAFGRFATVEDLQRVSGMGAATIERLRPFVFLTPP